MAVQQQQPERDGKPRYQVDAPAETGSEPRVTLSDNAERLNEHCVLYRNVTGYQVIVQVVGTSRPEKLETLAANVMDAAATLRNLQQGGER